MNALTTVSPGTGLALIPTNMREAMDLAAMMARGKLVPQALQNSPADCLLVIEQAARWGMSPFAVAQEVSVIQGKLMHSGKIVSAAVQSCGILAGRLRYDYAGSGDDRTVTVSGTLRGEAEACSVVVRLRDAKTSNQHWGKSPDQMLAYHGARVWARRYAPEVMLGVYSPEEFEAPQAEPREVPNMAAEAPPALAPAQPANEATYVVLRPDGTPARKLASRWLAGVAAALAQLESAEDVREWRAAMGPHIANVAEADDIKAREADQMIASRLGEFAEREPGEEG